MEPITTAAIATALGLGLGQVANKLLEKGMVEPALEPATEKLKKFVQRGPTGAKADQALVKAVQTAFKEADVPTQDEDSLQRWLKNVGLDRLTAKKNQALRRQLAQAILGLTDPAAAPPEELVVALGWPRTQLTQLSQLLASLRAELYRLDDWRAPIEYADEAAKLGQLSGILAHLARLDNVFVETAAGEALRVVLVQQGLSQAEAAAIESRYRAELTRDLKWHDFRGIVQIKKDIRLPLVDIYLELGLLSVDDEEERRRARQQMAAMREAERLAAAEERLRQRRVTEALSQAPRLVILGEPGAGKTISLRFITLLLAHGYGAARLGLATPFIPLMVRLADFARALEANPALSLDNFLLAAVEQEHIIPRLGEFMRLALEKGACLILLDGLDEVGDDPGRGQTLRQLVVKQVQKFANRWCSEPPEQANRLVVTSRIEGYWSDPLLGVSHVELSPLQPPGEVADFLRRWYLAHETAHDPTLAIEAAQTRAESRLAELLPRIMEWRSVRSLATNPLLLTILALIHDNIGKLPNSRIELYDICTQTLIESWRQAQTGLASQLLAELRGKDVIRIMAPLAYWLHRENPGGTASLEQWRDRLEEILTSEFCAEVEAAALAGRFLHHARQEAGLLAERSLGQFGFFHLTFEEYLAAREIARQKVDKQRELLLAHWEDARWHEVILLAAGQLGIVESKTDDASEFIEHLLKAEPVDPANAGRQVVLAGRALADIDPRSVNPRTRHWTLEALRETMQELDPDSQRPVEPPRLAVRTRYEAGEALDELGWLPPDLNGWLRCSGCADGGGDLLAQKYPVTNAQFERFILAGGYEIPEYWGGETGVAWQWRLQENLGYGRRGPALAPEYWRNPRFGQERRGYPVVGVSWYEANAYAAWLAGLLEQLRAGRSNLSSVDHGLVRDLLAGGGATVRLPTEAEWERLAGGAAVKERYPWDPPAGPATAEKAAILARANTEEAGLQGTSPVGMYPLGTSQPFGLLDLAGNVWEWTATEDGGMKVLRGGAWYLQADSARCGGRSRFSPHGGYYDSGFRLVSPVGAGC